MQKKSFSLVEATTNTAIGLVTSFLIQIVLYPIMNIPVRLEQNVIITVVFTVVSIIRSYLVRRLFNNKLKNEKKQNSK